MTLDPVPDDPADDIIAYRRALGAFVTGVCVVTTQGPEGFVGLTVNSFTSVSLEPRLVLWCLDHRSQRRDVFAQAERFSIHVLGADDAGLADRFARGDWAFQPTDAAATGGATQADLAGSLTRLDCAAHARIEMGDHLILVGRVETFQSRPGPALTYVRGRYAVMDAAS